MVNPRPADGKNDVLFQEISTFVRSTNAYSNEACGRGEVSRSHSSCHKAAKGGIRSPFKDLDRTDDGQEK